MQKDNTSIHYEGDGRFFKEKIFPGTTEPMPATDNLSVGDCAEAQALITRWADLSESDWLRLGPHLDHCDACRALALQSAKDDHAKLLSVLLR